MTVVTDNFDYTAGSLPTVSSSRWSDRDTTVDFYTVSDGGGSMKVWGQFTSWGTAIDSSVTPGADQYAKVTVTGSTAGAGNFGVVVRHDADTNNSREFYACYASFTGASTVNMGLYKFVSGAPGTELRGAATSTTFNSGDTLELRATGTSSTVLQAYRNGSAISGMTYTDSSSPYTSGAVGILLRSGSSTNGPFLDAWEGGDTAGASAVPVISSYYRMLRNS